MLLIFVVAATFVSDRGFAAVDAAFMPTSAVYLTLPQNRSGSQRVIHIGHVMTHPGLRRDDTNSTWCRILCAAMALHAALTVPIVSFDDRLVCERVALAAYVETDQVILGLQPAPPKPRSLS